MASIEREARATIREVIKPFVGRGVDCSFQQERSGMQFRATIKYRDRTAPLHIPTNPNARQAHVLRNIRRDAERVLTEFGLITPKLKPHQVEAPRTAMAEALVAASVDKFKAASRPEPVVDTGPLCPDAIAEETTVQQDTAKLHRFEPDPSDEDETGPPPAVGNGAKKVQLTHSQVIKIGLLLSSSGVQHHGGGYTYNEGWDDAKVRDSTYPGLDVKKVATLRRDNFGKLPIELQHKGEGIAVRYGDLVKRVAALEAQFAEMAPIIAALK